MAACPGNIGCDAETTNDFENADGSNPSVGKITLPANSKVPEGITSVYIDGDIFNSAASTFVANEHESGHSPHPPEKVRVTLGHTSGANFPN